MRFDETKKSDKEDLKLGIEMLKLEDRENVNKLDKTSKAENDPVIDTESAVKAYIELAQKDKKSKRENTLRKN